MALLGAPFRHSVVVGVTCPSEEVEQNARTWLPARERRHQIAGGRASGASHQAIEPGLLCRRHDQCAEHHGRAAPVAFDQVSDGGTTPALVLGESRAATLGQNGMTP